MTNVDLEAKGVGLEGGEWVDYDYLVLATGSASNDFAIPGVQEHAFFLKSLPDAIRLRNHVLAVFERANAAPGAIPDGLLTIVLVGGGPTGVEMAGALAELIPETSPGTSPASTLDLRASSCSRRRTT